MRKRRLGSSDLGVSEIAFGGMGMAEFSGPADQAESLRTMDAAIELGVNLFDTADMYGRGGNEELVGRAIRGKRERLVIATTFGIVRQENVRRRNGRPEYVRRACENSLKRLQVETID